MQYFGGKQRIAKEVSSFLLLQDGYKYFLEPFIGGCNIAPLMKGKVFASDANEYLIEMYLALQNGWVPPQNISEEEYTNIKINKDKNKALTGFVGIGCSYSGKWFGGYARNKTGRNYCLNAHNSLLRIIPKIENIKFKCISYEKLSPKNCLIYCDPPYKGTTGYNATEKFDHNLFWETMRKWSIDNTVLISEYSAPDDFKEVWKKETKLDIRNKKQEKEIRIEKIFKLSE
jgi:DNA adenine methylase